MTIMMPVRKRIPSHLQFIYQRTPRPTRKISSEVAPHNPLPPPKQASRSQQRSLLHIHSISRPSRVVGSIDPLSQRFDNLRESLDLHLLGLPLVPSCSFSASMSCSLRAPFSLRARVSFSATTPRLNALDACLYFALDSSISGRL